MAVKKNDPAAAPEKAAESKNVDIQLNRHTRYVYQGVLYEKDVKYTVAPDRAKHLLGLTNDAGAPVFGRFKAKPERVERYVEVGPREVDLSTPEAVAKTVAAQDKPKRIEIGDDSEIADLVGGAGDGDGEDVQNV